MSPPFRKGAAFLLELPMERYCRPGAAVNFARFQRGSVEVALDERAAWAYVRGLIAKKDVAALEREAAP
jgi:hypothetical protein